MTAYQLRVLREIDGVRTVDAISRALHNGYANGATYKATDALLEAKLAEVLWWNPNSGTCCSRTPAGELAIVNADKRPVTTEARGLF